MKNWVFGKIAGIVFWKKFQQIYKNAFFDKVFIEWVSTGILTREFSKSLNFGMIANLRGVFGKIFQSFQNRFNWQSFCSMIFKYSNGKNAQNFPGVSNFFLFPAKTEGFFEKAWIFFKNWCIFQICSRRRPIFL